MGTTAQKLEYLGTTKSQLKDMINYGLDDNNKITSSTTFRNYVSSVKDAFLEALRTPDTLFTNLPKKSASGSNISLTGTANAPMRITLSPSELTQASTPTPSSPQEVHTISGSNKVVVSNSDNTISQEADIDLKSKNLFNKNNSTSNYYLGQDGTPVSSSNYDYTEYISIKPNTYYMSTGMATGTGDAPSRCYYDKNKKFIIGYRHGNATDILNASPSNAFYMRESVKKVDVDTTKIYETPYYDYGFYGKIGNYEDKFIRTSGKNLLDYNWFNNFNSSLQTLTLTLKPNTSYTLSSDLPAWSGVGANLFIMKDGESASSSTNGVQPGGARTMTTDSTGHVLIQYRDGGSTLSDEKTAYWYMLNEGTTALPYEPYGSNEWYIKKNIGKVVLDGTQNVSTTSYSDLFYITSGNLNITYVDGGKCNYFGFVSNDSITGNSGANTNLSNNQMAFRLGSTKDRLYIKSNEYADNTALQTWFTTHNTELYYILATPTYTQITGTLANQLENVYQKLLSYTGQTNISQVNNDLPFIMNVSAIEV